MEISVARALTELKTLDSRIENKVNNTIFIAGVKKSSKNVNNVTTREDFEKEVKANFQSIVDLIARRKAIKVAIVESNAKTKVVIGGKEYTVADAIEKKSSIVLEQDLLTMMEKHFRNVNAQIDKHNEVVEQNLLTLIQQSIGTDNKKDIATDTTAFSEAYRANNCFEVVDPLKLKDRIETLQREIEDFETDVDAILTESNVLTKINIPD